jgi:DNA-binding transcriptional MerR regulator
MVGWTARELARLTNVPAPTVISWINTGLVTADRYGRGRGGHTIGLSGLMELLAVITLRDAGISLQAIRRAVENLRALSGQAQPLASLTIMVVGDDIVWKDASEIGDIPTSALHKPGQRLMIFPIGEQHSEILEQLRPSDTDGNELVSYKMEGVLATVS